ncbi:MAG: hypothetical protein QXG08_01040 [Candidatus Methanomethyliaceae archaeon]
MLIQEFFNIEVDEVLQVKDLIDFANKTGKSSEILRALNEDFKKYESLSCAVDDLEPSLGHYEILTSVLRRMPGLWDVTEVFVGEDIIYVVTKYSLKG